MIIKTFLETAGNFAEREILQKFHNGIEKSIISKDGATAEISIEKGFSHCDVAIIMGSWKPREKDHHLVRTNVVENASCFVVVETPLLGRKMFQPNEYFRVGVNGFLNNSGTFTQTECSNDRYNKLGLSWNGWQSNSNGNVLLLLQLPGDASLRGTNIYQWAMYAIKEIRKVSSRQIRIRTHPGHNIKDSDEFYKFISDLTLENIPGISFSIGKDVPLSQEFPQTYCTVAFSSGSSIDSIVHGIPTIACDPGNFAYDISSKYPSEIESLVKSPSEVVLKWLARLAYSQWTIHEMEKGVVWNYISPIIETIKIENPTPRKKGK